MAVLRKNPRAAPRRQTEAQRLAAKLLDQHGIESQAEKDRQFWRDVERRQREEDEQACDRENARR